MTEYTHPDAGTVYAEQVHQFINESMFYRIYLVMKDDFFQSCDCEPVREIYKRLYLHLMNCTKQDGNLYPFLEQIMQE